MSNTLQKTQRIWDGETARDPVPVVAPGTPESRCDLQSVKQELSSGQDVDCLAEGDAPVHAAAEGKYPELVADTINLLAENGADLNLRCERDGSTALHLVVSENNFEATRTLLERPEVNKDLLNNAGATPIHVAVGSSSLNVINLLCSYSPRLDGTGHETRLAPIHVGTLANRPRAVESLLLADGDPNLYELNAESTPLHIAAILNHYAIAQLLIARGADRMAQDKSGSTPAHLVPEKNQDMLQLLRTATQAACSYDIFGRRPVGSIIDNKTVWYHEVHPQREVFLLQSVMRLCRSLLSRHDTILIKHLGRCLVLLGRQDVDVFRIACLSHPFGAELSCDDCGEVFRMQGGFAVCRECEKFELCDRCAKEHLQHNILLVPAAEKVHCRDSVPEGSAVLWQRLLGAK